MLPNDVMGAFWCLMTEVVAEKEFCKKQRFVQQQDEYGKK
jgi:hypothetical protein